MHTYKFNTGVSRKEILQNRVCNDMSFSFIILVGKVFLREGTFEGLKESLDSFKVWKRFKKSIASIKRCWETGFLEWLSLLNLFKRQDLKNIGPPRNEIMKREPLLALPIKSQRNVCPYLSKAPKCADCHNTTRNRLFDLSNVGPSGQLTQAVNNVRESVKIHDITLPPLPDSVNTAIINNFKKNVTLKVKSKNLLKLLTTCDDDHEWYLLLLHHVIEAHRLNPKLFVIANLKNYSEMDLSLFFWGRILVLLFSDDKNIIVKSGEKKLENATFKIDYKIGIMIKDSFYTLSCIEIGRHVVDDKVFNDHHKLLLESKVIINNLVKAFPFIDPTTIPTLNLQICGLKGDFIETNLLQKKKYITHRPSERLRAPLNCDDSTKASNFIESLLFYKSHIKNLAYDLNLSINEHDDKRASFGEKLEGQLFNPLNFINWIDDNVERL